MAVIELEHVAKSFGDKQVLTDVSFAINPGTIVGYIGQNGAGKSTTVKMILGLLAPDAGTIKVFDEVITPQSTTYKQRIGYVPELADVFDALTAREYLALIGQLYGMTEADAVAKSSALMAILGLSDAFDQRIVSYSKGMRQQVLIIASLLHNPDILFWDEPLNGLDANAVLIIEEILRELRNRGKTIFYSSHIMDVVQKLSDRIILLNQGQVIADGDFATISQNSDTSLQQLFNDLTGFSEHGQKASAFVDVIAGGAGHGDN